jgi:hypothetical protein
MANQAITGIGYTTVLPNDTIIYQGGPYPSGSLNGCVICER